MNKLVQGVVSGKLCLESVLYVGQRRFTQNVCLLVCSEAVESKLVKL